MVASTVCSSKGLTGTNPSAEVVIDGKVDVVIERAKEAESDFWSC